jgi:uncharacterized protein YaaN involved in tellurite resistance
MSALELEAKMALIDPDELYKIADEIADTAEKVADMSGMAGEERELFISEAKQKAEDLKREIKENGA